MFLMIATRRSTARQLAATTSAIALALGCALPAAAQTAQAPQGTAVTPQGQPVPTESGAVPAVDASAQTVTQADDPASSEEQGQADGATTGDILVVGTRASLQSAIARKKNAGTVVDSIVADDIASFPDKNAGEALARVTGVQLSRDFGEGTQVSIRGIEPDLNRIEINGVSQQSALGQRGGDFRELQVELVKSIDVYKGYAVDLTEGGIGGTVSIETRRPLDLKSPIFSVRLEGQYQDLAETVKPRANLTAGRNDLFDGKFGFIGNVTYSDVDTRQDYASNTNWGRYVDFDRSASKTVADPAYANFGTYESCAGVTGSTAAAATTNRLACETQFFDWVPRIARYRQRDINDKRLNADLQLQYEFTDTFNVFGQARYSQRIQQLQDTNFSVDLGSDTASVDGRAFRRFNVDAPLPNAANGAASRPRVTPGTFTIDEATHTVTSVVTALNGFNAGTAAAPIFTGANNIVGIQRRDFDYNSKGQDYQLGFNWEVDRLRLTGFGSLAKIRLINNTNLVSLSTSVSAVTVDRRNDAGLPVIVFPEAFDPADPNDYAAFGRRGADGQLLVQSGPVVQYRPQDAGSQEKQIKVDADYDTRDLLPFITSVEYGGQYRFQDYINYTGGGARLLSPAVVAVPAAGIPASPAVFQPTANVSYTTVIGAPPATGPAANTYYFTEAQYRQFLTQTGAVTGGAPLFTGLAITPEGAPQRIAFPAFDYGTLSRYYDLSGFDQDLVRASGGLPQIPAYVIKEDIASGYFKLNFEQEIFGMRLTGNAGVRYTRTRNQSTSTNTRRENRIRPGTGITVNGVVIPAVIENGVTVAVQEISIANSYEDWLPAVNFNLEVLSNLFVRGTYAQNLARPKPQDLSPAINCVIDLADTVAGEDTCAAGNPALQPYRADQYDLNISWYPNADTLISVGYFYKDVASFIVGNQLRNGVDLFGDGTLFTVRQPINGFGARLDGVEASAQTVFTFLPAPFDGIGASANFTYSRALESGLTNLATNEPLKGFPGLSKYTYNASIFYDKDWLNLRLNYNRRTDWVAEAANANFGNNPIFRRGETFIDAKALFRIGKNYNVFFEGQNLFKEYSKTYIDDAKPIEYYYPGRRFFVGAQLKL